ncbi:hypothetical protein [Chromobacterium violaceum]
MERKRPSYVSQYMVALGNPAIIRWQSDATYRELVKMRSAQVIEAPWDTELLPIEISRKFGFLRDFWNCFQQCVQSAQALDLIQDLTSQSLDSIDRERYTPIVTFWMESYLNEGYIFQCRLLDFIKFIQRRYKKDPDFTEFVTEVGDSLANFVREQLEPLIAYRGAHVHERRHRHVDPELARLTLLDTMIDILGHEEFGTMRTQSRKDAANWLIKQIRHFSNLAWHLFDEVCRGFSDGILLSDINKIIIPLHFKDNQNTAHEI